MRRRRSRGQSLAEFAIVFPILALVLGAIIQFGILFWTQNGLNQVVRDTGRLAATGSGACDSSAVTAIRAIANEVGASAALMDHTAPWPDSAIDVTWPSTDRAGAMYDGDADGALDPCPTRTNIQKRYVTITIRDQAPVFFPFLPGNGSLSSTASYRLETAPVP